MIRSSVLINVPTDDSRARAQILDNYNNSEYYGRDICRWWYQLLIVLIVSTTGGVYPERGSRALLADDAVWKKAYQTKIFSGRIPSLKCYKKSCVGWSWEEGLFFFFFSSYRRTEWNPSLFVMRNVLYDTDLFSFPFYRMINAE